jgi:hypothetical protein
MYMHEACTPLCTPPSKHLADWLWAGASCICLHLPLETHDADGTLLPPCCPVDTCAIWHVVVHCIPPGLCSHMLGDIDERVIDVALAATVAKAAAVAMAEAWYPHVLYDMMTHAVCACPHKAVPISITAWHGACMWMSCGLCCRCCCCCCCRHRLVVTEMDGCMVGVG